MTDKRDVAIVLDHRTLPPNICDLLQRKGTDLIPLDLESRRRLDFGINLYKEKLVDNLLLCGGYGKDIEGNYSGPPAFPATVYMATHVSSYGIPSEAIVMEKRGRDTAGELFYAALYMAKNDYNSAYIVTSDWHRKRANGIAKYIMPKLDLEVIGISTMKLKDYTIAELEARSIEAFKQTFRGSKKGDLKSIRKALIKNHPLYNKD